MSTIVVRDQKKVFLVRERAPGMSGALRGLFAPKTSEELAVDGISFEIADGERVAFAGPNGLAFAVFAAGLRRYEPGNRFGVRV